MPISLTKEQTAATEADGRVIVSAAAGSGKTAVLVERIIKRFTDPVSPLSADRALIVTFTNAAASELKSKIERRLKSMLLADPKDDLLRRQNILIKTAFIGTIDSFCINLVRENFHFLGISRDFSIADKNETSVKYEEILDNLISEKLSKQDENIIIALKGTKRGYEAQKLKTIIQKAYAFACSMPHRNKWYDKVADLYESESNDFINSKSITFIFNKLPVYCNQLIESVDNIIRTSNDDKFILKYSSLLNTAKDNCIKMLSFVDKKDWNALFAVANGIKSESIRKNVTKDLDTSKKIEVFNGKQKKLLEFLKKNVYADDRNLKAVMKNYSSVIKSVIVLLKEYTEKIYEYSYSKNSYTFDQIEHFALNLLTDFPVVEDEFNNRYDVILVDECQDTNILQYEIFEILSRRKNQLFMVGDVKQSIYGFRNANPDNFLKRKDSYPDYYKGLKESRVLLNGNFRSRREICDFVNYIFSAYMTKDSADIQYSQSDMLIPLADFPNADDEPVELLISETVDNMKGYEYEAAVIARYINDCVKNNCKVRGSDGKNRDAVYGDFAILVRGNTHIADYVISLKDFGIPINVNVNEFLNSSEIATVLALLKSIDDFSDNISLFTLLRSPLFCFTNDEIAQIRLNNRYETLFANLCAESLKGSEKAKSVCDFLRNAAGVISTMPLSEFINYIYTKLSVIDIFSSFEDGDIKRANLLLFSEYAVGYDNKSGKKIRDFIKYIESDKDNNLAANIALDDNAVTITTIHKSKGLQYPVCIIAGLTAPMKRGSTGENSSLMIDENLGIVFDYFDTDLNTTVAPPIKLCTAGTLSEKMYKEELRLLYVALTRASDRLVLSVNVSNAENFLKKETQRSIEFSKDGIPFSKDALLSASSYADWLLAAMLYHKCGLLYRRCDCDYPLNNYDCSFKITVVNGAIENTEVHGNNENVSIDFNKDEIKKILDYTYRFPNLSKIPAKTSVTDILKANRTLKLAFRGKPSFSYDSGLSSAEKGTATHKFMEYCNYESAIDNIDEEISRLIEWQFITPQEAAVIDKQSVKSFFESYAYGLIVKAKSVYREYRFISKMNVRYIDSEITDSSEYSIVQGVADCVIENENDIIILDFKTDNISSSTELANEYSYQLELYAKALAKIFKKPVSRKILYSFKLRIPIEVTEK